MPQSHFCQKISFFLCGIIARCLSHGSSFTHIFLISLHIFYLYTLYRSFSLCEIDRWCILSLCQIPFFLSFRRLLPLSQTLPFSFLHCSFCCTTTHKLHLARRVYTTKSEAAFDERLGSACGTNSTFKYCCTFSSVHDIYTTHYSLYVAPMTHSCALISPVFTVFGWHQSHH